MPRIRAEHSALIDAPAESVYAILADYRHRHPQILPERYLFGLQVEQGGTGAGTVIQFKLRALGKTRTVRAEVSEPEPGRRLVETDLESGATTTFTVHPTDGGRRTVVTITTEWTREGVVALFERILAPALLRRIYAEELRNLTRLARGSGSPE